ncbi:hypothetical protein BDW62DRAFT_196981 [Aspergillus aurantiobrunneus]
MDPRCSRRFYGIALPHLYSDVSINENVSTRWEFQYPLFIHTIARRPDLGAAVHSLHLDAWITDPSWPENCGVYDIDLFKRLVREKREFTRQARKWFMALEARNMDAYLALIPPGLSI